MFKKFFPLAMLLGASLFSVASQADTLLTTVTNNSSATNGCSVRFVSWSGSPSGTTGTAAYNVTCGSTSLTVLQTINYSACSLTVASSAYRATGSCTNYSIYKIASSSTSSSASSSAPSCRTLYTSSCHAGFSQYCSSNTYQLCLNNGGTGLRTNPAGYYECIKCN